MCYRPGFLLRLLAYGHPVQLPVYACTWHGNQCFLDSQTEDINLLSLYCWSVLESFNFLGLV